MYNLIEKATMRTLVDTVSRKNGNLKALSKYSDPLSEITYRQFGFKVKAVSAFLLENGLVKGDHIMVLGESCPGWVLAYFGITYCGMVAVTVLPNFSAEEVGKIARHSEAKLVFSTSSCMTRAIGCGLPIVRMDDMQSISPALYAGKTTLTQNEAAMLPGMAVSSVAPKGLVLKQIEGIETGEDDVASIIYTSGTTGTPKGVMLTNRNLIWNADQCSKPFIHIRKGWNFLSILPLSHVYEFTVGLILPLLCGCSITYLGKAPSVSTLMPALKDVRPDVILSVPLLIEKIYHKAVAPQIKGNPKIASLLKFPLLRGFVYHAIGRKLINNLGGKLKFFGIGGAPLDKEVESFLDKAGFPYALGYGLTETSPFIAGCGPKSHKVGALGKVLPGVEVRIDPGTGEIQTRSPSVMKGYYKNPELTAQALSAEGWFCTGDTGYLKNGKLVLSGRIKDLILTSNGENIFPEAIESVINHQEFVQESLIIPNNGGLLALIKLDMDTFASNLKMDINGARREAVNYIQKLKESVNRELSTHSRINEVEIQELPFERTPTMKLKRNAIIKEHDERTRHQA